ncbi:MAG: phosphate ABC transporter permease PstA [Actinomycetota bacterium]|nr:phosphate ABC transporter permease PstA [Actinomycetota bacterium]
MSAPSDLSAPVSNDPPGGAGFDPTAPLTASGTLRRRAAVSRVLTVGATASAMLAVAVFGLVIAAVAGRGAGAVSFHFLTSDPNLVNPGMGGIAPAIVGSAIIVAVATAIAMPLGVLVAIFLIEFAGRRSGRVVRLALDLTNGLPTVIVALMIYGLIVLGTHTESGYAASLALAIIMLPLIARSSHQVLLLVPGSLREAADALGVSRWRSVVGVLLPSALGGIVTATILAAARAAGESAPLIILDSLVIGNVVHVNPLHAMSAMPLTIFNDLESGVPSGIGQAWGTAFVLMALILAANVGARMFLARNRTKLGL